MKAKEIYWYMEDDRVIMGYRGGTEYTMSRSVFQSEILRRRLDIQPIDYDKILQVFIRESQYIDFEEVKSSPLLLT